MSREFDPHTTRYHPGNALCLARVAKYAYEKLDDGSPDEDRICSLLKGHDPAFLAVHAFNANSAQGLVIEHERSIIAGFRGADEFGDWLDNIDVVSVEFGFGEVHKGFLNALLDIWPAIKSRIRELRPVGRHSQHLPLWLTGHSLGGAMATLAAAQLIDEDTPFYGVYTFGQPRVGNREFARIYNLEAASRSFRFQNNNDIVSRVPARAMGYSHVGNFVYISEDQKTLSSDVGFWFRFLDRVRGAVEDLGDLNFDGVKDHAMAGYLKAIEDWGDREPQGGFE